MKLRVINGRRSRTAEFPAEKDRREAILEISGVDKVFRVNRSYVRVLENISFSVATGELICLLGPSGCGKSTLLKIVAGFIPPSSGAISLNGSIVTRPGPDRCVVFQEDALYPWLTVRENIAFGLKGIVKDRKTVAREVDRFLLLVDLKPFADYLPREISGGMKQRVALARVLVLNPKVLLMDEPFGALDAQTRQEMQNLLLSLCEQLSHTILFVTHDINEAATLADRILVMDRNPGRIRAEIPVPLPRPRKPGDAEFHDFVRHLYESIRF